MSQDKANSYTTPFCLSRLSDVSVTSRQSFTHIFDNFLNSHCSICLGFIFYLLYSVTCLTPRSDTLQHPVMSSMVRSMVQVASARMVRSVRLQMLPSLTIDSRGKLVRKLLRTLSSISQHPVRSTSVKQPLGFAGSGFTFGLADTLYTLQLFNPAKCSLF